MLGLQVRYDRPIRPWLHLAPFLAGGINTDFGWTSFTGAAGVSAGLGWRHRLTADLALGPVLWDELNLHGTQVDRDVTLMIASDPDSPLQIPQELSFEPAPPTTAAAHAAGSSPARALECAPPAGW